MDAARRSKRYPSDRPLLVRCDNWAEFVQLYAADIGQGGMFIVTNEPPTIMSVIEIRIQLPEATDFMLSARVVHVVEPEQAEENKPAGIGVEFVDLDPERKRQIFQVIEFARWQGDNPNASLHRTMAELSNSVPPKNVASTLPQKAEPNPRKITLDGTEKIARSGDAKDPRKVTLDGTEKSVRPGDSKDPRKVTLDGAEKPVRAPQRTASGPVSTPTAPRTPQPPQPRSDAPTSTSASSDKLNAVKAGDPVKLKGIVTHFAHKRYEMALKELAQLLAENANDTQAIKWQAMCKARIAVAANDTAAAVQHYEKALEHDEGNREARDYVRTFHRDQRIASLPFGRYFTTKKK